MRVSGIAHVALFLLLNLPGWAAAEDALRAPAGTLIRLDPRFDRLVPPDARLDKLADGLDWVEGPTWDRRGGFLLFTDIPANAVYKWQEGDGLSLFLKPSGYTGSAPFPGREPGANGLTFDSAGRLVLAEHGDRRVARLESDGRKTTLAARYQGRRLNSPNDLVYRSNGDLYFTDPPFGLPGTFDDAGKELPFQGVYRLKPDGELNLLTREIRAPNGIAFSPDEKTLYLTDVDPARSAWLAYDVLPDGTIANGRVLYDATELSHHGKGAPERGAGARVAGATVEARGAPAESGALSPTSGSHPSAAPMEPAPPSAGAPDGLKVDREGNLYGAGPGGVHVFAPDGTLLGIIVTGGATGNCAWGDDGSTLYITAGPALYRIRLGVKGAGF